MCSTPLRSDFSEHHPLFVDESLSPVLFHEDAYGEDSLHSTSTTSCEIFPSLRTATLSTSDAAHFPSDEDTISGSTISQLTGITPEAVSSREHELKSIAPLLISNCCANKCLLKSCALDVLTLRSQFQSMSVTQRRQWLSDRLRENSSTVEGKMLTKYYASGKEVCQQAWRQVLSVSQKTICRILTTLATAESNVIQHGNKGKKRPLVKTEDATAWMGRYFHLVGDHMPHNNQIHLPSWDSQKYVYERYKEDMSYQGYDENDTVSLRSFYRLWSKNFHNVVIPEEDRFAKCDVCVKIKLERKTSINKVAQEELKTRLDDHLQRVVKERRKYHRHREKSRATPDKYMTIIIDGMDQAKTNLPYSRIISKSTSGLWRLRTHVTGALLHTKSPNGKLAYAFIDLLQWPHDSNLTITIIVNVLARYIENMPIAETLYLQLDNTSRENKNRYVIGFCAFLVEKRIFRKVRINFLPVGHTHEDVDQLFSKIADEIRRKGSESIKDLLETISRSSTPNPTSTLLDGVWDFKEWINPFLKSIKYHSKYLCFRFTFNATTGKAEMHYKRFSDLPWEPKNEGLHLLKSLPNTEIAPKQVESSVDKLDLEHLLRDLPKYKPWISSQSWKEWELFMKNSDDLQFSNTLHWKLPLLVESGATRIMLQKQQVQFSLLPETMMILQKENTVVPKICVDQTRKRSNNDENGSTCTSKRIKKIKPQLASECSDILQIGELVGLHCLRYNERPQIGRVIQEERNNSIYIRWYDGTYSGTWKPYTYRHNKKTLNWDEYVSLEDIVLRNVELTGSNRLSQLSCRLFKAVYSN